MADLFDPMSPDMLADPYPVYARLRREDPVHWHDGLAGWVLTRYEDCVRVLQDPATFGSDFRSVGEDAPDETLTLQTLDPPEHTALRQVVAAALRAVDPTALDTAVEEAADKQLSLVDPERFDFITEFAEPVGIAAMCALVGIPGLDDVPSFCAAQRDLIVSFDAGLAPQAKEPGLRARNQLNAMIEAMIERRPATGVLSGVRLDPSGPPRIQVVNALRGIFGAGYGSSSSMWGNAVLALAGAGLLDRPAAPALDAVAFNELIRYDGAVQAESRAVNRDLELCGRRIRRGESVVTVLGAANRDPARFAAPDRLELTRRPNPHIGFGMGVHACIGGRIGLRIGVRVLKLLADRYRLRLLEPPVRRPTATLRGLDRLVLAATPRPAAG